MLRAILAVVSLAASPLNTGEPPPIAGDALYAPQSAIAGTSEYMIGRVAVSIIFPESDGSIDSSTENWTDIEIALMLQKIEGALDWWTARELRAHLDFVYEWEIVPVSYEPINRPSWDEGLWIHEVMLQKGMPADLTYFDQARQFNHALLANYGSDHAFTIFVIDSSNDRDNRFSNDYFAYAYMGGPFTVMTYGNNGYGPHNMDAVAAHEIGHIFGAIDQYYSAQQPCTRKAGYLDVENQNSQYGNCAIDEPSIMRGQVWPYRNDTIDEYARGQVGWRDSDGDGILDPVDHIDNGHYRVYLPVMNILL